MQWLAAHLFFGVVFAQTMRFGQLRGTSMLPVICTNYAIAAALSVAVLPLGGAIVPSGLVFGLGFANGLLYFLHLLVVVASYRIVGVGVTAAIVSCGWAGTVLLCAWLWPQEEPMTVARWAALLLIAPAVYLMAQRNGGPQRWITIKDHAILVLCIVIAIGTGIIHKLAVKYGGDAGHAPYRATLFLSATIGSWLLVLLKRQRCARVDALVGTVAGLANAATTWFILLALAAVGAVIVFPVTGVGCTALNLLVAMMLWHERISRRQLVGVIGAMAIVVLTTMPVG